MTVFSWIPAFAGMTVISIALADTPKNPCANFDNVALQLAIAQSNMQPSLSLNQIQNSLGSEISGTNQTKTTYSWVHKNLVLIVKTDGDNITDRILTGTSDGDMTSKKMEQIHETLKSATSIWDIKKAQSQLGPGRTVNNKSLQHEWVCGIGSMTITTDQNDNITAADIIYQAPTGSIEKRLGHNLPAWDIKTDSLGKSYRVWKRLFGNY